MGIIIEANNGLWRYVGKDQAQVADLCAGVPYLPKGAESPAGIDIQPCVRNFDILEQLGVKWPRRLFDKALELRESVLLNAHDETPDERFPFLRPHQLSGMRWLVRNKRALLWDQVRSGKTLTAACAALALSQQLRPTGRRSFLVICSKPVSIWWKQELTSKLGLDVQMACVPDPDQVTDGAGVCVMHWEYLRRHIDEMMKVARGFDVVVIDEAQRLRNRKSKSFDDIARLAGIIPGFFALTGTPSDGKPEELWTQLNLVDSKRFSSFWRFYGMFVQYQEGYFGRIEVGPKNMSTLKSVLANYSIARNPVQAERNYIKFPVVLPDSLRKVYNKLRKEYVVETEGRQDGMMLDESDSNKMFMPNTISALMRMRQLLVWPKLLDAREVGELSPKIDACVDLIEESVSNGGNVLVFCSFVNAVKEIARRAALIDGCEVKYLIGGMGAEVANDTANWMNAGTSRVVISTYGVGSEGLGFHTARTCIFIDRPWSSIQCRQSEGRIDAPGQAGTYIDLVAQGTVDEYIQMLLERKAEFNQFIIAKTMLQQEVIA